MTEPPSPLSGPDLCHTYFRQSFCHPAGPWMWNRSMKCCWKVLWAAPLLFLLLLPSAASPASDDLSSPRFSQGHNCLGCVAVVSVVEQLVQVHNYTFLTSMDKLCSYLPEKLFLKTTCYLVIQMFGPDIIKLLRTDLNADVVCHTLKFCKQETGQPLCHLYPSRKETWKFALEKARWIVKKSPVLKHSGNDFNICSLPILAKLCQKIEFCPHEFLTASCAKCWPQSQRQI